MLVLDSKSSYCCKSVQPFTPQFFNTHQRYSSMPRFARKTFSAAQQVKVVILQKHRWDNALKDIVPTLFGAIIRIQFREQLQFSPGCKGMALVDLRSFRLQRQGG